MGLVFFDFQLFTNTIYHANKLSSKNIPSCANPALSTKKGLHANSFHVNSKKWTGYGSIVGLKNIDICVSFSILLKKPLCVSTKKKKGWLHAQESKKA